MCFNSVRSILFDRKSYRLELLGAVPLLFITYFSAVLIFLQLCEGTRGFGLWYCGVWGTMTFLLVLETSYVLCSPLLGDLGNWLLKILFSVAVNVAIGLTLARWMPEKGQYQIGRDRWFLHGCFVFMSEICYLRKGRSWGLSLFKALCCSFIVSPYCYLQSALFKKSSMRKELETIQLLWHQQKGSISCPKRR